ncbi:helix-turn-helix transcriptional regulator [Myxococcus sp. MISCRS1]|uniref:helix-turn-helix domain-containing protein n=1 Tax=Myxococcus sp. MISCRS1 TaxID=2996786 RepID=UPI00226D82C0|nr:helix-turn-helix transcriptional regulator [Myxococcus sp. MISCRS1]MCY1000160.1 helix-turn-helix transcriptional regulator [Myxococcus sp. MISCRS1]
MAISLRELGELAKAAREEKKLSQEDLAKSLSTSTPTNRATIAYLELGQRLPAPETLQAICESLQLPAKYWKGFLHEDYQLLLGFEEALGEMVGRPVTLRFHDEHSVAVAQMQIRELFGTDLTPEQIFERFNSTLVFYDIRQVVKEFFHEYLGPDAFRSTQALLSGVRKYQKDAIRLFSTFTEAYARLNAPGALERELKQLEPRSDDEYHRRSSWKIETISDIRLPDLGYISASRAKQQREDRQELADFLRELAEKFEIEKATALQRYPEKMLRRMDSLLRQFQSKIQHGFLSPLFAPDADALRREADVLAPKGATDIARMEETQALAQRNLARYLSADHLDVYVATSMRSEADYVSVSAFVSSLFAHESVRPLKLRFFNPTQSWIEDRVAKGLVEALMLRRSSLTIYMAQKIDTFGKDSEASVALGQGKPVIVYVPRLHVQSAGIDSEELGRRSRADLKLLLSREHSIDADDALDDQSLFSLLLTARLQQLPAESLAKTIKTHWADFDLYGEDVRIKDENERAAFRSWLDDLIKHNKTTEPSKTLQGHVIGILVATAIGFERRAKLFREQHPLALQVILSTGVLNGILVVRSVDSCGHLLRMLLGNSLEFDLEVDEFNYRLIEKTTRSTMRVISRNALIGNAFEAFYSRHPRSPDTD